MYNTYKNYETISINCINYHKTQCLPPNLRYESHKLWSLFMPLSFLISFPRNDIKFFLILTFIYFVIQDFSFSWTKCLYLDHMFLQEHTVVFNSSLVLTFYTIIFCNFVFIDSVFSSCWYRLIFVMMVHFL